MMRFTIGLIFLYCVHSVVVEEAKQTINLETQLTKIEYYLKIADVQDHFLFSVESSEADNLALISAKYKDQELSYSELDRNQFGDRLFKFDKIPAKGSVNLKVKCTYFHLQRPKPSEIEQKDKQFVRYRGNANFYSPYEVKSQSGIVVLPRTTILHHQFQEKKSSKAGSKFHIGPLESKAPFSKSEFFVHFETIGDFLTVKKLDRSIELSHWGNVAVEDSIDLYHSGAKLKGSFSRFDFKFGHGLQSVVRNWHTFLPNNARQIYYRDAIGNVSTSTVTKRSSAVDLEIEPRFPLMGGWKTQYILGYNLPTRGYLYQNDNQFALKVRAIDHIHSNQFVQELNLEIVLPECVENVRVEYPYSLERLPDSFRPTYLDTTGRLVLKMRKMNLVEDHIEDIIIYYEFSPIKMFREFFLSFAAFFIVMLTVIVYVRLDFSIQKDEYQEVQKKVQSIVAKLIQIYQNQGDIYEKLEHILKKYRLDKDSDSFNSEWKLKMKAYGENKNEINSIKNKISTIWPEGLEKINNLINMDNSYMELVQESNQVMEKFISGKLNKSQYQSIESDLGLKKSSIIECIDSCIEKL